MTYHPYRSRKDRYWVCRECPAVWRRLKGETERYCYHHGLMRAARTYPYDLMNRGRRKAKREQAKAEQKRKPYLKVRTLRSGRLLTVSRVSRLAYKALERSGTRKTFQRHASAALAALNHDFRTCHHGVTWPDRCEQCPKHRSYGGSTGMPVVVVPDLIDRDPSTLGQFNRNLFKGKFEIAVKWEGRSSIPKMAETFLHEVVHFFDSYDHHMKDVGCSSHDRYFYARLEDLTAKMRVGVRRTRRAG